MTHPKLLRGAALAIALLAAGCGGERTLSGIVRYKGQPVAGGQVSVIAPDGKSVSGTINPDGTYTVVGVPAGEVVVTVTSVYMDGEDRLKKGVAALQLPKNPPVVKSAVPVKYNDPKVSGLKYNLDSRSKTIDIDLTD